MYHQDRVQLAKWRYHTTLILKVLQLVSKRINRELKNREHSDSGNPWMGELGAQVITGLPGNPIHTLSKQFRFDLK